MPVRCFPGIQVIGPFYPTYKKAIIIHNRNGEITHDVITEGECILLPSLTGLTGEQIAEAANEIWMKHFNSKESVQAFIAYSWTNATWQSICITLIEF